MALWLKCLTIAAGVLAAMAVYAVAMRVLQRAGMPQTADGFSAVRMISANLAAIAAAAGVSLWPSDRARPLLEPLATWALATCVLMAATAPQAIPVNLSALP